MSKLSIILILCIVAAVIPVISAAEDTASKISLQTGIAQTTKTAVNLTNGYVTFTDKEYDLSATTVTQINGIDFVPSISKTEGTDMVWGTGEKSGLFTDDPIVKMQYSYTGNTLKETITLKEDRNISFKIDVKEGSKLIPWYNGEYKIVKSDMTNTMDGVVLQKPYGVDSNGHYIDMVYEYNEKTNTFKLTYDRILHIYNDTLTKEYNKASKETDYVEKYDLIPISYPLVIDPTWVSFRSHWIDNTTISGQTIEMWNVTGTTSWTVPDSVSSVWVLVIAGGGSGAATGAWGGGGGAGGLINQTLSVTSGKNYGVVVGAGGARVAAASIGNTGSNSSFYNSTDSNILYAAGGGAGARNTNGGNGGSGGGAPGANYIGGLGISGQGKNGGSGDSSGLGGSGGGGAGHIGYNATNVKCYGNYCGGGGDGLEINITGIKTYYAGGGDGANNGSAAAGLYIPKGGGGSYASATLANPGTHGLGGGGSGAFSNYSGYGGSGVVIIRYNTPSSAAPIASFTKNTSYGTSPLAVALFDTSTNSPTSWAWYFTNITGNNTQTTFSTNQNVNYTFGNGNWSIRLNATNAGGSNVSEQQFVNVSGSAATLPVVQYTIDKTFVRFPKTITVNDTSLNTPTSWEWYWGDGTANTTTQNATHQYTKRGAWNVILTATNAAGSNTTTATKVKVFGYEIYQ